MQGGIGGFLSGPCELATQTTHTHMWKHAHTHMNWHALNDNFLLMQGHREGIDIRQRQRTAAGAKTHPSSTGSYCSNKCIQSIVPVLLTVTISAPPPPHTHKHTHPRVHKHKPNNLQSHSLCLYYPSTQRIIKVFYEKVTSLTSMCLFSVSNWNKVVHILNRRCRRTAFAITKAQTAACASWIKFECRIENVYLHVLCLGHIIQMQRVPMRGQFRANVVQTSHKTWSIS